MNTYVILRRGGWRTPGGAARKRRAVRPRWATRKCRTTCAGSGSYVLEEGGSTVGTVCIYQATSPEAIREHASRAMLPVDEIIPVADTVIVRPDPQPAAA